MIVYVSLTIATMIFLYLSRISENKIIKNFIFVLSIMLMTVVAGIRWNVGTDFLMYNDFFEVFKNRITFTNTLEPMFMIFCYIPGRIFNTSFMTFTLIALFIYSIIGTTCKKNCKYYDMSIVLFLCLGMYFSSLNILRQWMSIALLLRLYTILDEKIGINHFLLMILSFMCHYTSIFVIPILFICRKISKEKIRIILLIAFVILKFIINTLLVYVFSFISNITFFEKYFKYFSGQNYINASILWPLIFVLVYIFYIVFMRKKMPYIEKEDKNKINVWVNILIFAFGFEVLGTNIDIIERMSHYFYPIIILIIPKVYEYIENKENKKIILFGILLFCFFMMFINMKNNGGQFLPYQTIFGEVFE